MPVTPQAVVHLQAQGHDAIHASAVGLGDKSDGEVLERARAEDRLIVTADLDYPRLLALLKADRPGLILFRGGSFSDTEMLGLLDRVLAESTRSTSSTRSSWSIVTGSVDVACQFQTEPRSIAFRNGSRLPQYRSEARHRLNEAEDGSRQARG
jgi:predicted nuclease of predicted toxin-antitoxin system